MRISALTVSVNYADLLANSIDRWLAGCEKLLIVTSPTDEDTLDLARSHDCLVHATDAFYREGAAFNKGLAISEAVEAFDYLDDWQLLFDADMVPQANWRQIVEAAKPQPGFLYGATRQLENGERFSDRNEIPGYFQLFHASDTNAQRKPLLDTTWRHAGGMDSEFHQRWPMNRKRWLDMTLIHQGEPGMNWHGRGNYEATARMLMERIRCRGIGKDERFG